MNLLDLLSLIIDNLTRRKARVALTAVGVIIGTGAVVILVSLGSGLQRGAAANLMNMGDLTMVQVWPGYGEPQPGGEFQMTPLTDETVAQIAPLPGVKAAAPWDSYRNWAFLTFGRTEGYGQLVGIDTSDLSLLGLRAQQGTLQLEKGSVVIGANVAMGFRDPRLPWDAAPPEPPELLDKQITIVLVKNAEDGTEIRKKVRVRVAGILTEVRNEADSSVYMPLAEMNGYNRWLLGKPIDRQKEGYGGIFVKVEDVKYVVDLTEQIVEMGYNAWTPQEMIEGLNSFFKILQVVFGGVGAISLLVAAIGIANTMTMAILERTREIGLMKAVGATNRHILSVFLGEAAGIGFLGGLGGVLLGWGLGQVLNVLMLAYYAGQAVQSGQPPPSVAVYTPLWLPVFTLVFSTVIGFLSGLYPALGAATLAPVTALKYE